MEGSIVPDFEPQPALAFLVAHAEHGTEPIVQLRSDHPSVIGRDPRCADAIFDDLRMSRRHAQVVWEDEHFVLHDLGSLDGTYVNDRLIDRCVLADGDLVRLGNTSLSFKYAQMSPTPFDNVMIGHPAEMGTPAKGRTSCEVPGEVPGEAG